MSEHENDSVDMDTVSWVIASEYRMKTCRELKRSIGTPKGLADSMGKKLPHVSRALGQLQDRDMVQLESDEDRKKGRIYSLTEKGRAVLEKAETVKR